MRATLEDIKSTEVLMDVLGVTELIESSLEGYVVIVTPKTNYIVRPEPGQMLVIHKGEEE